MINKSDFLTSTDTNRSVFDDPFARPSDLGAPTSIDDKFEEETEALKATGVIPREATTDAGYETMLSILGKKEPSGVSGEAGGQSTDIFTGFPPNNSPTEAVTPEVPSNLSMNNEEPKAFATDVVEQEDKPTYTDEEVLPILDAILTAGYAKESFNIRNAKCVLRTQFFWEDQFVVQKTDELAANTHLKPSMNFYLQVYALAANLESLGGASFPTKRNMTREEQEESFNSRIEYLNSLPSILVDVLYRKRTEFIQKIQFIQENFDRLIKVF